MLVEMLIIKKIKKFMMISLQKNFIKNLILIWIVVNFIGKSRNTIENFKEIKN